MPTAKEEVRRMLDSLPDDATFEDIQYHIYVREKIECGLEDARAGRVLSEEEVERRMARLAAVKDIGDEEEQRETWEYLKRALDEDRLSDRKLFP